MLCWLLFLNLVILMLSQNFKKNKVAPATEHQCLVSTLIWFVKICGILDCFLLKCPLWGNAFFLGFIFLHIYKCINVCVYELEDGFIDSLIKLCLQFCWATRLWWGPSVCRPKDKATVSPLLWMGQTSSGGIFTVPKSLLSAHTHLLSVSSAEFVNAQELPTDMKSITDRAAQTLLWTELFRGQWVRFVFSLDISRCRNWPFLTALG